MRIQFKCGTLPQYLHASLTAMKTMHIGKNEGV